MSNKLNIEEIKYLIPDYISGGLDENEKKAVEAALKESQEVKDFYNEVKLTLNFVSSVRREEPPAQYWNNLLPRIHQRIEGEAEKKTAKNPLAWLWKVLVPVAAVVLIFIVYELVTSPEKQMVKQEKFIEKKEIENNNEKKNIEENKENKKEEKDNLNKEIKENNEDNNTPKVIKRTPKVYINDMNNENTADNMNNEKKNEFKENILNGDDKEEIAAVTDIDEMSIISTGQGAGFDEDIEKDLNKLDNNEQNNLLQQLSNSNL